MSIECLKRRKYIKELALLCVLFLLPFHVMASGILSDMLSGMATFHDENIVVEGAAHVGAATGMLVGAGVGIPISLVTAPYFIIADTSPTVVVFLSVALFGNCGAIIVSAPFLAISQAIDYILLTRNKKKME